MTTPAAPLPFKVGDSFTKELTFDREGIMAFATMAGDFNPLHHDEALAKASRFKGLIASGTHTSAVMVGALATYVSSRGPAVGLDFSVKMKKAVHAGETMAVHWTVTRVEWKASLGGDIVVFEGEMRNRAGEVALTATATNLAFRAHDAQAG